MFEYFLNYSTENPSLNTVKSYQKSFDSVPKMRENCKLNKIK